MMSPTLKRGLVFAGASVALAAAAAVGFAFAKTSHTPVVGAFTVTARAPGFVVAAPHGDFDTHTDTIAEAVCERLQWSCIVARGFETEGPRVNVNRPTEGVRRAETAFSGRAAKVYSAYLREMRRLSPQVQLYVELHGNGHEETRNRIEIATSGISEPWARQIRLHMNHALAQAGVDQYTAHVDVLEPVRYAATHNREFGALSEIEPALHIELPMQAREEHQVQIIEALQNALRKSTERIDTAEPFALGGQS